MKLTETPYSFETCSTVIPYSTSTLIRLCSDLRPPFWRAFRGCARGLTIGLVCSSAGAFLSGIAKTRGLRTAEGTVAEGVAAGDAVGSDLVGGAFGLNRASAASRADFRWSRLRCGF